MLGTRKSMGNLMQTAQGPFLIHFRYWFQPRAKEGTLTKLQFGKKPVNTSQTYKTGQKYTIFDIATRSTMPVCRVESDASFEIDLKKYQPGLHREHTVTVGKIKFGFVMQLLSNTTQLTNLYSGERISDEEKFRYEDSVNDLIRSQAEFLAKFQKDTDGDENSKKYKEEINIQNRLTAQLATIKPVDFNFKIIFIFFVLFFMVGYFSSSAEEPKRRIKKKSKKIKL